MNFPHINDSSYDEICDFFYNRIYKGEYNWKKYTYNYANENYLKNCLRIVCWIDGIEYDDLSEQEKLSYRNKICLTELVHCKSMNEEGLNPKCINKCTNEYIYDIIDLFLNSKEDDKYIIISGTKAKQFFLKKRNQENHDIQKKYDIIEKCKEKGIIFIESFHPSYNRGTKEEIRKKKIDKIIESKKNQNWIGKLL